MRTLPFLLVLLAGVVLAASASAAAPQISAHRGGSLADGQRVFAENTLPAFDNAARHGWVLELDVKLTRDRRAVVMHDDTLDRTTTCTGLVSAIDLAELRERCLVDQVTPAVPVPTLQEVLDLAAAHGATVSPEIKNNPPTTPAVNDFDPTTAYATTVAEQLRDSGFPQERMIVQSFWPVNLEAARTVVPNAQLAYLTLAQMNPFGPPFAAARDYDWVSPGGLTAGVAEAAKALGRKLVPYTLNDEASIRAAAAAGADAIITDDPVLAERVLGAP